jgi:hypothetical protein
MPKDTVTLVDTGEDASGFHDFYPDAPDVAPEVLFRELTAAETVDQGSLISNPRFHRPDLLRLLLTQARAAQLVDPIWAASLGSLAGRLARRGEKALPVTAPAAKTQADLITANAYRLAKRLDLAEATIKTALPGRRSLVPNDVERADYCLALALIRWETGHSDEADALLQRACHLFALCLRLPDAASCALLSTLLCDESGSSPLGFRNAIISLIGDPIVACCPPWLVARAFLTFAGAFSSPHSSQALDRGLYYMGQVSDDAELLRLLRLEGRARARISPGQQDGEQILEAVRRKHLESRSVVDLTLASLDLLALRTSQGDDTRIDELYGAIASLPASSTGASAIDRFVALVAGDEAPWLAARSAASWYLLRMRLLGPVLEPLLFTWL